MDMIFLFCFYLWIDHQFLLLKLLHCLYIQILFHIIFRCRVGMKIDNSWLFSRGHCTQVFSNTFFSITFNRSVTLKGACLHACTHICVYIWTWFCSKKIYLTPNTEVFSFEPKVITNQSNPEHININQMTMRMIFDGIWSDVLAQLDT